MQSCFFLFFFLPTFHDIFKIFKNCPYDFHEILHSHSTPKGAPTCAMASKSYDWNVRNIAKISPKMAKKQPFFDFFRFLKNYSYDSNEFLYSHSTPYYGPLRAISSNSYGWDSSESEGKRPKPTLLPHMQLWFSKYSNRQQKLIGKMLHSSDFYFIPAIAEIMRRSATATVASFSFFFVRYRMYS